MVSDKNGTENKKTVALKYLPDTAAPSLVEDLASSYIGYTSQEVKVSNGTPLKITLKSDSKSLNEVVVVGYGTQKKTNITGAVSVVKADELSKAATASIGTMLRG